MQSLSPLQGGLMAWLLMLAAEANTTSTITTSITIGTFITAAVVAVAPESESAIGASTSMDDERLVRDLQQVAASTTRGSSQAGAPVGRRTNTAQVYVEADRDEDSRLPFIGGVLGGLAFIMLGLCCVLAAVTMRQTTGNTSPMDSIFANPATPPMSPRSTGAPNSRKVADQDVEVPPVSPRGPAPSPCFSSSAHALATVKLSSLDGHMISGRISGPIAIAAPKEYVLPRELSARSVAEGTPLARRLSCPAASIASTPSREDTLPDTGSLPGATCHSSSVPAYPCADCGSLLVWSNYATGAYAEGWFCNNYRRCGGMAGNAGKWRWFCQKCSSDFCQVCKPTVRTIELGTHVQALPGKEFFAQDGTQVYRQGDQGTVTSVKQDIGGHERFRITWDRTRATSTLPYSRWTEFVKIVCEATTQIPATPAEARLNSLSSPVPQNEVIAPALYQPAQNKVAHTSYHTESDQPLPIAAAFMNEPSKIPSGSCGDSASAAADFTNLVGLNRPLSAALSPPGNMVPGRLSQPVSWRQHQFSQSADPPALRTTPMAVNHLSHSSPAAALADHPITQADEAPPAMASPQMSRPAGAETMDQASPIAARDLQASFNALAPGPPRAPLPPPLLPPAQAPPAIAASPSPPPPPPPLPPPPELPAPV